jgi:WhiB family transcriptional regulator, redox-sensing transcriptional regulator
VGRERGTLLLWRGGLLLSKWVDQDWRAGALCARSDPNLWFSPGAIEHREAKRICGMCPVRTECLAFAMTEPVDHGVWGGMTERERRRYRREAFARGELVPA